MLADLTDEELMGLIGSGSDRFTGNQAFDEVFARYHHRVVGWCYRVTRDHELAHDLAQEVFLKAFRHSGSFRGDSRVSTWIYSITRNHCLSAVKRRAEETVSLDTATQRQLSDNSIGSHSDLTERTELFQRMMSLMHRTLEPLEVRVMTLHYAHEIPLATITRQLALTNPSGAKAYIVNARRKLNGVARRRGWEIALAHPVPFWPEQAAA